MLTTRIPQGKTKISFPLEAKCKNLLESDSSKLSPKGNKLKLHIIRTKEVEYHELGKWYVNGKKETWLDPNTTFTQVNGFKLFVWTEARIGFNDPVLFFISNLLHRILLQANYIT